MDEANGVAMAFATVGVAGGDLTLGAGGQEFLTRPAFGAGTLGQAIH